MTAALDLVVSPQAGLQPLLAEVRAAADAPPRRAPDAACALFEAELRLAVAAGDASRATDAAVALWRRSGELTRCYEALSRALDRAGACGPGGVSVPAANRSAVAAGRVVAVLRDRAGAGRAGARPERVVVAAPPGDHHSLALDCLASLVEEAGFTADVVGPLAPADLADAAAGAVAVLLSVHLPTRALPGLVTAARSGAPGAYVAVGGPAATLAPGADLVRGSLPAALAGLRQRLCPLSEREREVVRCVAAGLTNGEAADVLGVAVTTLKTHLDHIFVKTGTGGRAAVVAAALRNDWIR